jgi:hypothetical protein
MLYRGTSRRLLSIVRHRDTRPCKVWVERRHFRGDTCRVRSKVFLVYIATRPDDECHNPGRLEFDWPSDQRETASHMAGLDIALRPSVAVLPLCFEDAEIVLVVLNGLVADQFIRVTRPLCRIDQRLQWVFGFARSNPPIQAVVTSGSANEACGIDPVS